MYAGPFSGAGFGHRQQRRQNPCLPWPPILVGRREKHKLVSKQAQNWHEVINAEKE